MFVVLDQRPAWGAYLADRLRGQPTTGRGSPEPDRDGEETGHHQLVVRHLDDLEALDSCLVGSQMPVGALVASDFAELDELVFFLRQHARRQQTLLFIASHDRNRDIERLLLEAGAHYVVSNMADIISVTCSLRQFFTPAKSTIASKTN